MQKILLILPVVIPVIFWAAYHYHKDRHLPEPPLNLLLCFGLGLIAAAISKLMYLGLEPCRAYSVRLDWGALGHSGVVAKQANRKSAGQRILAVRATARNLRLSGVVKARIGTANCCRVDRYDLDLEADIDAPAASRRHKQVVGQLTAVIGVVVESGTCPCTGHKKGPLLSKRPLDRS